MHRHEVKVTSVFMIGAPSTGSCLSSIVVALTSIIEIRQLLQLSDSPDERCDDINRMIDSHVIEVEQRISDLQSLRKQLKSLRNSCSDQRTVKQCGILSNLSSHGNI